RTAAGAGVPGQVAGPVVSGPSRLGAPGTGRCVRRVAAHAGPRAGGLDEIPIPNRFLPGVPPRGTGGGEFVGVWDLEFGISRSVARSRMRHPEEIEPIIIPLRDPPPPPPLPMAPRVRRTLALAWPFVAWMGALSGAVWLYFGESWRGHAL